MNSSSLRWPVRSFDLVFDNSSLSLTCDVTQISDFIQSFYAPLLGERQSRSAGQIRILRTAGGIFVEGIDSIESAVADPALLVPHLKREVILHFIRDRPDLLWLHAGAISRRGKAVIICGPSGSGKSTLTTLFCDRGWSYMADDIAAVRMTTNEIIGFPQTPNRRVASPHGLSVDDLATMPSESFHIDRSDITAAARFAMLLFPRFKRGKPTVARLSSGETAMRLLGSVRNFDDHKGECVRFAAAMASQVPAYELSFAGISGAKLLLDSGNGLIFASVD